MANDWEHLHLLLGCFGGITFPLRNRIPYNGKVENTIESSKTFAKIAGVERSFDEDQQSSGSQVRNLCYFEPSDGKDSLMPLATEHGPELGTIGCSQRTEKTLAQFPS